MLYSHFNNTSQATTLKYGLFCYFLKLYNNKEIYNNLLKHSVKLRLKHGNGYLVINLGFYDQNTKLFENKKYSCSWFLEKDVTKMFKNVHYKNIYLNIKSLETVPNYDKLIIVSKIQHADNNFLYDALVYNIFNPYRMLLD